MSSPHTTYDFAKHPGVDLLADGSGVIGYTILGTASMSRSNSSFEDWLRDIAAAQGARRCRPGLPAMAGFRGECFLVHKEVLRDWLRGDGSGTACYTCVASADAFPSTAGEEGWFYVTRLELERGVFLRRQWGATQPVRVYLVDRTPESRASAVAAGRAWLAEREDKRYREAMDSLLNSEITKRGFVNAQELERQLSARFDANRGHARKALHNAVDKLRVLSDNVPASNRQQVYRNQIKELMQQLADISTHVLNMDPFRA